MLTEADEAAYSLFSSDVVRKLYAKKYFMESITYNYNLLSIRRGCIAKMSVRRLSESHQYWMDDVRRATDRVRPKKTSLNEAVMEAKTKRDVELDHFKHAAFLAFWLRKMNPINLVNVVGRQEGVDADEAALRKLQFIQYGNELCALQIGYQICLNYETANIFPDGSTVVPQIGNRSKYLLTSPPFTPSMLADFAMILKHKAISPYSLYLMYRSLFRRNQPTTDA